MPVKITVNGVAWDSVDAMPPDVRRLYEQTLASMPDLADRDGDGIPDIVEGDGLSVRRGTTVRKQIILNGTSYDDVAAMPPDVRALYERAMQAIGTGGPAVTKHEIKVSFQLGTPLFRLGARSSAAPASLPPGSSLNSASEPQHAVQPPTPIEPDSAGAGARIALILAACLAVGILLWFAMRGH